MDTGWLDLSAFTNIESGSSGPLAWLNPSNAVTSDDAYASAGCDGPCTFGSQWLAGQNIGNVIPSGSIIDGIEIAIEGYVSNSSDIGDAAVVKGGVVQETVLINPPSLTGIDTIVYAGGATELWGLQWKPADINASDFGVALNASGGTGNTEIIATYIDHMQVKVYYSKNLLGLFLTI